MLKLTLSYREPLTMEEAPARIRQLADKANYDIDHSRPAKMYYRSGVEMVRMANVYAEEGNLEGAYVLYLKFMTIFLEKIREHPEFRTVTPGERAAIKRHLELTLPRAEAIKRQLIAKYEQEHRQWVTEQKRREQQLAEQRERAAREHERLEQEEQERRRFAEEKQRLLELERRRAEQLERTLVSEPTADGLPAYAALLPEPPSAPPSYSALQQPSAPSAPAAPSAPPPSYGELSPTRLSRPSSGAPAIDRSVKPSFDHQKSLLSLRSELRTVVVPDSLMPRFLKIAEANTNRNVETCGLLCGKPSQDNLYITHVLIPAQTGTSDSCNMEGEEKVFAYLDTHNLITLGWIHTHPSQTAFLSSVDLHTHCGYQLMMLESIAIVCAPKYNETGFFMLTPSYGLDYIANCHKSGFHPHPQDPPLFEEAQHVTLDGSYEISVVDLRQ
ncbi:STAM-binding protein-like A [Amphibalanus amphitrite]|uniref:STAM-binding protein-like A n=1 Tax=Amphibalanus amphitrite TaxID=1232801 RepID=UPI001C8FD5CF|nr:STAM-binding protein-like A [Amphibalanus amphitrite]